MTTIPEIKALIKAIGFSLEEGSIATWVKSYANHGGYTIKINIDEQAIDYGKKITCVGRTTCNFHSDENFVVLECVNRLLEKGYKPNNIFLEKVWRTGHGTSGRLDILVTRDDSSSYMMIECKTFGAEFSKEFKNIQKNGGQLFTYFQQDRSAEILMLYGSQLDSNKRVQYQNEIIKIEDDYRQTTSVKDFFDRWNKIPKNNGVFEDWVNAYHFESKALTPKSLKEIRQEDSSFIFNRFLEILRHNVVSDKPNAFNKIFTLFLCKVYDEKTTKPNEELKFQWLEGKDDEVSFQIRLTDLYKNGMLEFLEKEVSDFSESEFDQRFASLFAGNDNLKQQLKDEIIKLRLEKNNEFAIKEVFDHQSFMENSKIVKEVVELLQGYRIRYNKRQQYLSDFFELLLTTGLKQESGQFFTPVPIAQFIIKSLPLDDIIEEKLSRGVKNELLPYIIDYAAGSGHFLTESMHEVQRLIDAKTAKDYIADTAKKISTWQDDHFDWATQYVYGIEKDYRLVKVGKVGCYLHGDGLANVILSDGLANFSNTKEYKGLLKKKDSQFPTENKQFDIVISNPPYSVASFKNASREYYNENDFELYDRLTDNSSEIECLFIERTKQLLKDGGIAGIILPSSILNNAGIYTKAREIILQHFEVIAIAELGGNTFMATDTNTATLFLRRRSNYDSINLRIAIDKFFTDHRDVALNGIEKPIDKYIKHVWEGCNFNDYKSLLTKKPNEAIAENELYKEYRKKIKSKNEEDFWKAVIDKEKEKVFYFILAYPQQVVVIKSGQKDDEKRFLGYEFSFRRGQEGIHPIQRSKTIDECTKMYDADRFDNPEKASTYIYNAFKGDFNAPIHDSLKNHMVRLNLVDMLSFDRLDFEKSISTAAKKKIKIETKWDVVTLGEVVETQYGFTEKATNRGDTRYLRITDIKDNGTINLNNESKFINPTEDVKAQYQLSNNDIVIARSGSVGKAAIYKSAKYPPMIFASYLIRVVTDGSKLLPDYLFALTKTTIYWNQVEANAISVAQPNLNAEKIKSFRIPLPPTNIQKKIVSEIEGLEKAEEALSLEIEKLRTEFESKFKKSKGKLKRLDEVCELKAGSFVKADDIKKEFSSNLFPCYGGNGLRGYTKTFTNDGQFSLVGRQGALCGNVHLVNGKFHATEHALVAYPKEGVDTIWLHYQLKFMNLNQYATGAAQPGLSVINLNPIEIQLPTTAEQKDIVAEIEKINSKIQQIEKQQVEIVEAKETVLRKHL